MPPVKYWEIVGRKLSAAGWTWDYCSAVTRDSVVSMSLATNNQQLSNEWTSRAFCASDIACQFSEPQKSQWYSWHITANRL